MFENSQIETDGLPVATDVAWQPLDAGYRRLRVATAIATTIIIAIGASVGQFVLRRQSDGAVDLPVAWLIFLVPALGLTMVGWVYIAVPKLGYAVRERDVLYKSGVWWRSLTAIPFNRIQHVEKDSSPLDRFFGVANLKIFTAGSAGGDLRIEGLSDDVAERLRAFLLDRIGSSIER